MCMFCPKASHVCVCLSLALYKEVIGLKTTNPELKVHLAVGGWTMGTGPFHQVTASQSTMQTFARNAREFLRLHKFDGLDLDWEFPKASHKSKFSQLCKTLYEEFTKDAMTSGKPRLLLTAAVSGSKTEIENSYEPQVIQK